MKTETDRHCIDLTQLSSREQLSALMDGALPADQTRFLLRRLQHDTELAANWERWRIAGDAMRGIAPTQHLSVDFAQRVAASLHGVDLSSQAQRSTQRPPRWLRWGAGSAVAAALAVVALMGRSPLPAAPATGSGAQVAVQVPASPAPTPTPMPRHAPETPQIPAALTPAPAVLAAAATVAVAKPVRRNVARVVPLTAPALELAQAAPVALPQTGITSRPWPRKILPQYDNASGLTVGFGEHASPALAPNPFVPPVFATPPKLLSSDAPAQLKSHAPAELQSQP
jgi:negative regulator of sigma E activity